MSLLVVIKFLSTAQKIILKKFSVFVFFFFFNKIFYYKIFEMAMQ